MIESVLYSILIAAVALFVVNDARPAWQEPLPAPLPRRSKVLPPIVVQVGDPRSVTTMQFVTLCAAVALKVQDIPDANVDCFFISFKELENDKLLFRNHGPNDYSVVKTHGHLSDEQFQFFNSTLPGSKNPKGSDPAWVFHTTFYHTHPKKWASEFLRIPLPQVLTTDTSDVVKDGFAARKAEFEEVFSLTPHESHQLYDYVEAWDILRMCCGEQMSTYWRQYLVGDQDDEVVSKFAAAGGGAEEKNPADICKHVDLDAMERRLMQTAVFKRMKFKAPALARLSNRDPIFDGTYCSRCAKNIADFGLKFNQNCDRKTAEYCASDSVRYNKTLCS